METGSISKKETLDTQSFHQDYFGRQDTSRSTPSRSDESLPVAWEEISIVLLRSHARENPLLDAEGRGRRNFLPSFGRDLLFLEKPSQANLSDVRALDSESTPKKKGHGQAQV